MRKIGITVIIFIMILGISTMLCAASATVRFKGADEVRTEEEQIITVEISNSEAIGVIEGILSYDSNIKDVEISSSYNGWTVTYNKSTGKFNAFKAEGTTNGEVLEIKYKLDSNALESSITLNNIELTTISYENIKIDNEVSKKIKKISETNKNNEEEKKQNNEKEELNQKDITTVTNADTKQASSRKYSNFK